MGTPDFAVTSLNKIIASGIEVAGVVTVPDRKSGRGQKVNSSPVKKAAESHGIPILQPEKLKNPEFLKELNDLNADLFVVVAFRMLPKEVWQMPALGTINLHGSLLPQYRGAAPINWAIINGEKKTGVTTFFIDEKIDTGAIIDAEEIEIGSEDTAGVLHDNMMHVGADLLSKTINKIFKGDVTTKSQKEINESSLRDAPKIFKEDCAVDWNNEIESIYNKIRGLSPYPAAYTTIVGTDGAEKKVKLFKVRITKDFNLNCTEIRIDQKKIYFGASNGALEIMDLQIEGKKRMDAKSFLNGFSLGGYKLK